MDLNTELYCSLMYNCMECFLLFILIASIYSEVVKGNGVSIHQGCFTTGPENSTETLLTLVFLRHKIQGCNGKRKILLVF